MWYLMEPCLAIKNENVMLKWVGWELIKLLDSEYFLSYANLCFKCGVEKWLLGKREELVGRRVGPGIVMGTVVIHVH